MALTASSLDHEYIWISRLYSQDLFFPAYDTGKAIYQQLLRSEHNHGESCYPPISHDKIWQFSQHEHLHPTSLTMPNWTPCSDILVQISFPNPIKHNGKRLMLHKTLHNRKYSNLWTYEHKKQIAEMTPQRLQPYNWKSCSGTQIQTAWLKEQAKQSSCRENICKVYILRYMKIYGIYYKVLFWIYKNIIATVF